MNNKDMHNTTEDLNDIEQFERACQNFDWFYDFSDDHRAWRAGNQRSKVLDHAKNISAEHEQIFSKYQKIANVRRSIVKYELTMMQIFPS